MAITQLSNSSLDRFNSCPLSYFHRYLNPERPKQIGVKDFYAHYGTLMHFFAEFYPRTNFYPDLPRKVVKEKDKEEINAILDAYGNRLMERGKPITVDEMKIIYNELFPMIEFPNEEMQQEYFDQGNMFIETLPEQDWSKVVGLEDEFEIDLGMGLPPIVGFIDKLEKDENGYIVTDYKSSKVYTAQAILKKNQLPLYGMACYLKYGELPYKYVYHFTRFNKKVEVEVPIERLTQAKNAIAFTHSKMKHFDATGKFPAQYNSFYCNAFCGYQRLCETYKTYEGEPDNG